MESHLLAAEEAAARLGIKRATLYAYVSRGLLRAYTRVDHRGSWFDPVQLDALMRRARGPAERRPDLRITSTITLIERGRYWYRGQAPDELATTRSYESVAEWLWTGEHTLEPLPWCVDEAAAAQARTAHLLLPKDAPATDRLRVIVAILGATDRLRTDLRPMGVAATARRLVATAVAALARRRGGGIAEQVGSWVRSRRLPAEAIRAIDRALIIMADHELAASTLAVRIAASFRADPYAAVVAGLGAMAGSRHGAASRRVEEILHEVGRGHSAEAAIGRLLGAERVVPGFGHPLYPDGDPRAAVLFSLARTFGPTPEADAVFKVAAAQGLPPPNVDFALTALTRVMGFAAGAGETLFTVGRLAGWLAHAIEEYTDPTEFRLRAVYAGVRPE